jgi:hypothetical protein
MLISPLMCVEAGRPAFEKRDLSLPVHPAQRCEMTA